MIHQIDSKYEWLLLSVTFTGKLDLVFVLTFENAFSYSFHFKANRKIIGSFEKPVLGFFKIALRLRDRQVFMCQSVKVSEKKNVFQKMEYSFLVETTKIESA